MLIFRPYKPCDAEIIATWVQDEKTFFQWSADRIGIFPMLPEDLNNHYNEQKNNVNFMTFTVCDENAVPVGHMLMRYQVARKRLWQRNAIVSKEVCI